MKAESAARQRFVVLDTMRGYAACVVMTLHYGYLKTTNAYMAVDFFFLLSGFVLAHAYFNRPDINFWSFAQYRLARLYPLHLLTFLLTAVLLTVIGREWYDGEFILHLFMLHNIGLGPDRVAFNSPAWSISVEFWVNLAIGLLAVLVIAVRASKLVRNVVLGGIAAVCYLVLAASHGHVNLYYQDLMPLVNLGLLRGLGSICVGVLLYDVFRALSAPRSDMGHFWLQILTPVALGLFLVIMVLLPNETPWDFVALVVMMGIVIIMAFEVGPIAVLARKFDFLGRISFSIYLVHVPIQWALKEAIGDRFSFFTGYLIQFAVVIAVSYLTYTYFEKPSYAWGKRALRDAGNWCKKTVRGRQKSQAPPFS
ncbi:MAG: acyltransferase [Pseudomonadota bacterium]